MINKNILLADDDLDDCMLFEDALREVRPGSQLKIAHNGQLLMDMLLQMKSDYPDVIFLDLNMPCKNGLECLDEIRQTDHLKKIPIIIFSTTAQQQSIDTTFSKGANDYIQKPSSFIKLKNILAKILHVQLEGVSNPSVEHGFLIHPDNV